MEKERGGRVRECLGKGREGEWVGGELVGRCERKVRGSSSSLYPWTKPTLPLLVPVAT